MQQDLNRDFRCTQKKRNMDYHTLAEMSTHATPSNKQICGSKVKAMMLVMNMDVGGINISCNPFIDTKLSNGVRRVTLQCYACPKIVTIGMQKGHMMHKTK